MLLKYDFPLSLRIDPLHKHFIYVSLRRNVAAGLKEGRTASHVSRWNSPEAQKHFHDSNVERADAQA